MNTTEANRPQAEQALVDCYKQADLPPPRFLFWHANPTVTALAAPIISHQLEGGRVRNLPENLFNPVTVPWQRVSKELTDKVLKFASEALDQLKPTKRGIQNVNFRTTDQAIDKNVRAQLTQFTFTREMTERDGAYSVPSTEFSRSSMDASLIMNRVVKEVDGYLAKNETFTGVIRLSPRPFAGPAMVREAQMLQGTPYARLVEACGWVLPYQDFAVLTDNPSAFKDQFLSFRDGWYAR